MADKIDLSDLGATPVVPSTPVADATTNAAPTTGKIDLSDLGATPVTTDNTPTNEGLVAAAVKRGSPYANLGLDPVTELLKTGADFDRYNKLTPEQKKQYDDLNQHMGNVFQEGLKQGTSNGITLGQKKDLFNKPEDLTNAYAAIPQQYQDIAQRQGSLGQTVGQVVGSAPLYAIGTGIAGAGAGALGSILGTGAELTGEAANAVNIGQKVAQGALNVGAQGGVNAALGATQGYNDAAPGQEKAGAIKGGIVAGLLGAGGAAAGEVPGVINSLGRDSSNKVLANAALGTEGVNTATQAGRQAITQKGEQLASNIGQGVTDLNNTLGKEAAGDIQHTFANTAKDAQTSVEDIVNTVSNNLDTIAKSSAQASMDTINNSFAEALKQTGEQQNLTGAKLTDFIKEGLDKYGPVISTEIKNAAANGTNVPVSENFLKTFLAIKNAKVSLPGADSVQNNLWKNWADTLYDVSENTVKQSAGKIPGGANVSEVAVSGKGVLPTDLPSPVAQGEFVPGAQGNPQLQPKSVISSEDLQTGQGMQVEPETQTPPAAIAQQPTYSPVQPGVNAPLNITTNKAAQSTAGQFEGMPYSSQSGTQVNQTFTPKTSIPVDEAKQLAGAMGNASGTPEIGYMAADLSKQLKNGIKTTLGKGYANATAKYASLKSAAEEMGVPKIQADKLTAENITPDGITSFIQSAAKMADQGDTATLNRVYAHLNEVDPTFAANFKGEVDQVSRQMSELKKAQNAAPDVKASVLQDQGLSSPQVDEATQNLQDIKTVQKQIGTAAPKLREFVNGLNPSDIGSQNDLNTLLSTLDKVDPESAALLRSKASQQAVSANNQLNGVANKSPLDQAAAMQNLSNIGPLKATQLAQQLEDLDLVNKNIGSTTNLGTPSDTTRNFIKNFGKSTDTPQGSATASDIDAIVGKLAGIDPTLAASIKSEAPEVGRQLRAIDYGQSGSGFGSNVATKALGGLGAVAYKGANLVGQASRVLNAAPAIGQTAAFAASTPSNLGASNDLSKLQDVITKSPQVLGQFAKPLQDAASRGSNALAAMHYTLYNTDPKYRTLIDPMQDASQKQQ